MTNMNFDFGGFIDDENLNEDEPDVGYEEYLTVEALLQLKFGERRGSKIYKMLMRFAKKAAEENGGEPGLLFTQDGGEFVSFHNKNSDHA